MNGSTAFLENEMTDREILELAAKAAGIKTPAKNGPWFWLDDKGIHEDISCGGDGTRYRVWNPLQDDGDALRLAVRLNIPVFPYEDETSTGTQGVVAKNWGSKEANTRRAIVKAAAEIGKGMAPFPSADEIRENWT